MPLCSTEEAIAEIRQGKMIILVDDEDRENEGDLTMAAEFVTPEAINFMAKFGRGLICLPMSGEMADKLQLPLMAKHNGSRFGTNFTVSIEAREGISTGISAADRATTIKAAVADGARPDDLVSPGHVFPLRARTDGVLARAGGEDYEDAGEEWIVWTAYDKMQDVAKGLEEQGIEVKGSELTMVPTTPTQVSVADAKKVQRLVDRLDELEDVQNVYHTMDMTDEIVAALEEE